MVNEYEDLCKKGIFSRRFRNGIPVENIQLKDIENIYTKRKSFFKRFLEKINIFDDRLWFTLIDFYLSDRVDSHQQKINTNWQYNYYFGYILKQYKDYEFFIKYKNINDPVKIESFPGVNQNEERNFRSNFEHCMNIYKNNKS